MLVLAMGKQQGKRNSVALHDKERRAAEMFLAGVPGDDVAKELGYANRSGAWKAAMRCIDRQAVKDIGELQALELAKLNLIERALMPHVLRGSEKAASRVIDCMKHRLRLVPQLEVPAELNVSGTVEVVTKDEFATWVDAAHAQFLLDKERKTESAEA